MARAVTRRPNYDAYAAQHHAAYDTGAYDATAWTAGTSTCPPCPAQATAPDVSGQWDASAWLQPDQSADPADRTQQWEWGTQVFDTGAYDATQWNSDGHEGRRGHDRRDTRRRSTSRPPDAYEQQPRRGRPFDQQATATFEHVAYGTARRRRRTSPTTPPPSSTTRKRSPPRRSRVRPPATRTAPAAARPPSAPRC